MKLTPSRRALLQRLADAGDWVEDRHMSPIEKRAIWLVRDYLEYNNMTAYWDRVQMDKWRIRPDRLADVKAVLENDHE